MFLMACAILMVYNGYESCNSVIRLLLFHGNNLSHYVNLKVVTILTIHYSKRSKVIKNGHPANSEKSAAICIETSELLLVSSAMFRFLYPKY